MMKEAGKSTAADAAQQRAGTRRLEFDKKKRGTTGGEGSMAGQSRPATMYAPGALQ
nr:hypothetical protein [Mesorhizobium loti]